MSSTIQQTRDGNLQYVRALQRREKNLRMLKRTSPHSLCTHAGFESSLGKARFLKSYIFSFFLPLNLSAVLVLSEHLWALCEMICEVVPG